MASVEKESTKLADVEWTDTGKMVIKFADGIEEKFDPHLCTVSVQQQATRYGFGVRFQRLGSLEVKDYPTKFDRMTEYRRRVRELRDHYYSGTDNWDIPKAGRAGNVISEADLIEAIDRAYPGKGQQAFNATLAKHGGDLSKVREVWLATKQIATAWADIQAERKAKRAEGLGDADALLASVIGA